jgi:HK97 family phage prohead protease
MDRLAFDCELKFAGDGEEGVVEGYASMFGLLDRGGDILQPGAFKATLAEWKKRKANPPMLWQHDPAAPVGIWTDLVEDDKGLKVKGQLILDVPAAATARALMRAGAVKGLSIGYRTLDDQVDRATGARLLKKVELWEISLVTFPMLPEAQITGVKSDLDPRELERALRSELNLSSATAVKAVALVKKHLRDGGGQTDHPAREGTRDVIMSLRKAAQALR